MKTVRAVLMVEFEVRDEGMATEDLEEKLDAFREATQPSNEWGLTIWKATREDLEEMAAQGALLPNPGVLITRKCRKKGKKTSTK